MKLGHGVSVHGSPGDDSTGLKVPAAQWPSPGKAARSSHQCGGTEIDGL
jgi:hypothetical protein